MKSGVSSNTLWVNLYQERWWVERERGDGGLEGRSEIERRREREREREIERRRER